MGITVQSQMASELLLEYFILHTYFLLDTTYSILSRKFVWLLPSKGGDVPAFGKIEWNDDTNGQILDLGRSLFFEGFWEMSLFKVTISAILDGSFRNIEGSITEGNPWYRCNIFLGCIYVQPEFWHYGYCGTSSRYSNSGSQCWRLEGIFVF